MGSAYCLVKIGSFWFGSWSLQKQLTTLTSRSIKVCFVLMFRTDCSLLAKRNWLCSSLRCAGVSREVFGLSIEIVNSTGTLVGVPLLEHFVLQGELNVPSCFTRGGEA